MNCLARAQLSCNYTLSYSLDLMNVYFLSALNVISATYATEAHQVDGKNVLKDG